MMRARGYKAESLPQHLRPFFWDCEFRSLSFRGHRDFVIERLLAVGDMAAIAWLRQRVGDDRLREWIVRTRGRSLRRQQITYWGLVLNLPPSDIKKLLAEHREWMGARE